MFFSTDVNYIAIIVTGIIYLVLGALWFSPAVFGKKWLEAMNMKPEEMKGHGLAYLWGFLVALVISFVLALFFKNFEITTAANGALFGFWAWLGFIATSHLGGVIWEKRPFSIYLITAVFFLIYLVITGAILAIW